MLEAYLTMLLKTLRLGFYLTKYFECRISVIEVRSEESFLMIMMHQAILHESSERQF